MLFRSGCGSGILSVAAILLGAKSAVGVDIDQLAVKTAIENAEINGISDKFHRTDCVNVINLPEIERQRLMDAEWQESLEKTGEKYVSEIVIYANNRNGLLADISRVLTERNIDIITMNTRTSKQGIATMATSFEISSREELNKVIEKIRMVESIIDIERTTG